MSILIIGASGSMGTRYQAILSHLRVPFIKADKEQSFEDIKDMAWGSTGIILATPTDQHCDQILNLLEFKRPILCEKPITKDLEHLGAVLSEVEAVKGKLSMMMQYKYISDLKSTGLSSYNYFRHGLDGLIWDCMQIIALANDEVDLQETSPVWKCKINGTQLNQSEMDYAYVQAVADWLKNPEGNLSEINLAHTKVHLYEMKYGKN